MNILDNIILHKQEEIKQNKKQFPLQFLINQIKKELVPTRNFFDCLNSNPFISIIAELKFASPSRGLINKKKSLEKIIKAYTNGGASAISVLTEKNFFHGHPGNIYKVKKISSVPVLRKDFIFDEYQIYQSRCMGADAILLIASLLDQSSLSHFQKIARSLNMDCLVEVHNIDELYKVLGTGANIIGINNRNLENFSIDLSRTGELSYLIPKGCLLISESGIKNHQDIEELSFYGIDGVLIGETLMSANNLNEKLKELVGVVKKMGKGNKLTMIKICGIKDMNSAQIAIDAGVNALGFVFTKSSRRIFPEDAKKIIQNLPKNILHVGVFVNAPISLVKEIAEYCNLTALQFHGTENVNYCRQYKRKVIKAIKVSKDGQLFPDPTSYRGIVKYFLTDTYQPDTDGGTGKVFPWENLEKIKKYGLVILAGGLNPNNIFEALSVTNPWGVDVSSGVETDGCKDDKKIKKYMEEIQRWENG